MNEPGSEEFEFNAATIDDHGLCPSCGKPVRRFENVDKITHACDACGYHDVTFKWFTADVEAAPGDGSGAATNPESRAR